MIAFSVGRTLGPGDLTIMVRDQQGNPVAPTAISYSIFNTSSNPPMLVSGPRNSPVSDPNTVGYFYINITIPTNWVDGEYRLVWYLQQYPDSPEVSIYEDFTIVNTSVPNSSFDAPSILMTQKLGISDKAAQLITLVRELLSDTNPDRNYHFRPPTAGKVVAGYNTRVGFIWTDQTILRFLNLAIAQINSGNIKNFYSYTVDSIPESWYQAACVGAASKCLMAEAIRWNADEFSYSLNGVSLDINKAAAYQGLAEVYASEFKEWITTLTANRPFSAGLRQQRWLLG